MFSYIKKKDSYVLQIITPHLHTEFKAMVMLFWWRILKERNARVFNNSAKSLITRVASSDLREWSSAAV
jgi:hypothetical protein